MASPGFGDESRMLQSEVSRLEDLLAATRAERDEIGSKYMAVSDKVKRKLIIATFSLLGLNKLSVKLKSAAW